MPTAEHKKLESLQAKHEKVYEEMVKAQRAATQAFRKTVGKPSVAVQKLIDKGFKYEYLAFRPMLIINEHLPPARAELLNRYLACFTFSRICERSFKFSTGLRLLRMLQSSRSR